MPTFETEVADNEKQLDIERQKLLELFLKEETGDIDEIHMETR